MQHVCFMLPAVGIGYLYISRNVVAERDRLSVKREMRVDCAASRTAATFAVVVAT